MSTPMPASAISTALLSVKTHEHIVRCRCGLGEVNGGRGGKGRGAPANDGGPRRLRACGALRETPSTGQRRPALPRASPAVPSALAGLASGFGMGPGVPRPPEPLTGGRRSAHPGRPPRALGAAQRASAAPSWGRGTGGWVMRRARAISAARLRPSPTLHLRPINQVVYLGPYRKEN